MIGSLRGRVASRTTDGELIVEVGGVGYRISTTPAFLSTAGGSGAEVFLHVHTHVREDAIVLYGFASEDERRCFEALLGAHGVGPALALSVLSALPPEALARAVLDDDVETLCTVPGVGRKTAARMLIDLKHRLAPADLGPAPAERGGASGSGRSARAEVRAALVELGYGPEEIREVLVGQHDDGPVEELLRQALRELATR